MKNCPACQAVLLPPFYSRPGVPVHQNLLCGSEAEAKAVHRGDLSLCACRRCGLVSNAAFREELLTYEGEYNSNQSCSPAFERHVEFLVESLLMRGVRDQLVVEVGCGTGYFLRRLCRAGNRGTGFDPGYSGLDADPDSGARFVRGRYSSEPASPPDVLVCRHVIEHVASPVEFLVSVTANLPPSTRVFFETPSLEWIVEQAAPWDLFYEHCNYFTEQALSNVFRQAGLSVVALERVFNAQYLWIEARRLGSARLPPSPTTPPDLARFAQECERVQRTLTQQLELLARAGRVWVWGAAAKGSTYANLVDSQREHLMGLIDVNPARWGAHVAGSGHAVASPAQALAAGATDAIVMNPNYEAEIRAIVERQGASLRLHRPGVP